MTFKFRFFLFYFEFTRYLIKFFFYSKMRHCWFCWTRLFKNWTTKFRSVCIKVVLIILSRLFCTVCLTYRNNTRLVLLWLLLLLRWSTCHQSSRSAISCLFFSFWIAINCWNRPAFIKNISYLQTFSATTMLFRFVKR